SSDSPTSSRRASRQIRAPSRGGSRIPISGRSPRTSSFSSWPGTRCTIGDSSRPRSKLSAFLQGVLDGSTARRPYDTRGIPSVGPRRRGLDRRLPQSRRFLSGPLPLGARADSREPSSVAAGAGRVLRNDVARRRRSFAGDYPLAVAELFRLL